MWRLTRKRESALVELTMFEPVSAKTKHEIEREADEIGTFLATTATCTIG
jgi:hypothetical protein